MSHVGCMYILVFFIQLIQIRCTYIVKFDMLQNILTCFIFYFMHWRYKKTRPARRLENAELLFQRNAIRFQYFLLKLQINRGQKIFYITTHFSLFRFATNRKKVEQELKGQFCFFVTYVWFVTFHFSTIFLNIGFILAADFLSAFVNTKLVHISSQCLQI